MKSYMKEGPEDELVRRKLWDAHEREALAFALRYADAHRPGQWRSASQWGVIEAACHHKGYPVWLIEALGRGIRRQRRFPGPSSQHAAQRRRGLEEVAATLRTYRQKIGLRQSRPPKETPPSTQEGSTDGI